MDSALLIHRLHFDFTITYHCVFPQLTMGLAPMAAHSGMRRRILTRHIRINGKHDWFRLHLIRANNIH